MHYRNAAAPWLYAAGGVVLGLVGLKAISSLKRRTPTQDAEGTRDADPALAPVLAQDVNPLRAAQPDGARTQHSGENALPAERYSLIQPRKFDQEPLDDDLEAVLDGTAAFPGDSYDAVAPDDLGSEWLSRATEAAVVVASDEPLDAELAEMLRDAGISVISEASLNSASAEQFEARASADLDGDGESFELEFDYAGTMSRQ